ncbi:MAG: LysM peptidoglycan-binding domain-containing protein [Acidiferrobacterales bacterium]
MSVRNLSMVWVLGLLLTASLPVAADTVSIKPDHPERYTVVKGDTLWDISSRFLKDPWQWAKVWTVNTQIKNPHLIYPGDVIVFTTVNGKPELSLLREQKLVPPAAGTEEQASSAPAQSAAAPGPASSAPASEKVVKLEPEVRPEPLAGAIPTIDPNVIGPFLTQPLVVSRKQLDSAGYVTQGVGDRIVLGDASEFYARGLGDHPAEFYQIFRKGKALKNPDNGKLLGYEAIYLGDARLLTAGDPAKLVVTRVTQEILPTDRLLVAPEHQPPVPYYFPHSPGREVRGRIVSALNSVQQFGPMTVVAISLGREDGMKQGDVLRIMHHVGKRLDPVTQHYYKIPDQSAGLLMVFRVLDKVSYALVMTAERPIRMYDVVRTP